MTAGLPISQYWHSSERPDYIRELTGTFAALNPTRTHILFDAATADAFLVEHFTSREVAAFRACGPPAMQADYLRYCSTFHFGGIWADAGFECRRDLSGLLEGSRGGHLFRSFVSEYLLMNGLMAFAVPRHPFLRLTIDFATELIDRRWKGKVNAVTGFTISAIANLSETGSFDDFISHMTERQREAPQTNAIGYARLLCELVGDYDRVTEACEGIRILPAARRSDWVDAPKAELGHRNPSDHWSQKGSDIYSTGSKSGA
jgi:hypothetical protein